MRKCLILFALAFIATSSFSQVARPQSKQELIGICDKFMDMFKDAQFKQGFNFLKHYSVLEDDKLDTLAATATRQIGGLRNSFGRMLGYERVSTTEVKNCIVKLVYIVKFERSFLELRFLLYSGGNASGWTINNIKYDQTIEQLNFEEPKRP